MVRDHSGGTWVNPRPSLANADNQFWPIFRFHARGSGIRIPGHGPVDRADHLRHCL